MKLPATISTDRLVLRPFEIRDLDGYLAYYTGKRTGGVGGPKPAHVVAERFMAMAGQWVLRGYGRYAISVGSEAIGHAGILHAHPADPAEMTWSLWQAEHEGKGLATEAAHAVLAAWKGAALVARIAPDNQRSRRVAERIGMTLNPDATPPQYDPNMLTYCVHAQESAA